MLEANVSKLPSQDVKCIEFKNDDGTLCITTAELSPSHI